LVLTRTADGIYILGNPSDPMVGSRLWGLNIRSCPAQTENTAVLGAFKTFARIFRKRGSGIVVRMSTEHDTYFVYNKVAILAEERLLLAVYRPAAFCTVTGI
jgi:HK97 family phage major capsid protein